MLVQVLMESESMAHDQLLLDFSVADTAHEKVSMCSATVHDFDAARRLRQQADLGNVYEGIYESVRHIRLSRSTGRKVDSTPTER
jgi:hypothetical protein